MFKTINLDKIEFIMKELQSKHLPYDIFKREIIDLLVAVTDESEFINYVSGEAKSWLKRYKKYKNDSYLELSMLFDHFYCMYTEGSEKNV